MRNFFSSKHRSERGYVILFTVLICSIILAMALGIANVAYREDTFTIDARDSHYALFAADSAAECALHYLLLPTGSPFVDSITGDWVDPVTITCGEENGAPISLRATNQGSPTSPDYIFDVNADTLNPAGVVLPKGCGIPRVVEVSENNQNYIKVQGIGYNFDCTTFFGFGTNLPAKLVQRAIEYNFSLDANQNSGNPISGSGVLNISGFDPGALTGTISSTTQNSGGGVLGNSQGGTLWTTLTNFFANLFGINTNGANGGGTINSGNYQGQLQTANQTNLNLLQNPVGNNGSTNFQSNSAPDARMTGTQSPDYAPVYGTTGTTTYQKTLTTDANGNLYVPDDSLSRLSTGLRVNTAADTAASLKTQDLSTDWFNRFFGADPEADVLLKQAQLAQQARQAPVSVYDSSVLQIKALPDGVEKSVAIANTVLSRYADLSGDTSILKTVDPKSLVEIAQKMSFDGAAADPSKVAELFKQYDAANGTSVASTINSELLAKIVTEFASISETQPVQTSVSVPILRRVVDFFLNLFGQAQQQAAVSRLASTQDDMLAAKSALAAYGDATKDWTTVSVINPEILSSILSQYSTDGVITEEITSDIVKKYAAAVNDPAMVATVDLKALTTALNEARLDSRIMPATATTVSITEDGVTRALMKLEDPTNPIQVPLFTKLANTILPDGPVTPDIAKVFLDKYAEATGDTKAISTIDTVTLAGVLNDLRANAVATPAASTVLPVKVSLLSRMSAYLSQLLGVRQKQAVLVTYEAKPATAVPPVDMVSFGDKVYSIAISMGVKDSDAQVAQDDIVKNGFLTSMSKDVIDTNYGDTLWNAFYAKVKETYTTLQAESAATASRVLQVASTPISGYQEAILKVKSMPDGTEKDIAIANTILSQYSSLSGDASISQTVDPKSLIEIAQKMSFDGAAADPSTVGELFKQYDAANGTSVASQVNNDLFAKVVSEFASVSKAENTPAPIPVPITRQILNFFLSIFGQAPQPVQKMEATAPSAMFSSADVAQPAYVAFKTPVPVSVLDSISKLASSLGISDADALVVRNDIEKNGFFTDVSNTTIVGDYGDVLWGTFYEKTKDIIYAAEAQSTQALQQANQTPQAVLQLLR